jgi:hypothetical protein
MYLVRAARRERVLFIAPKAWKFALKKGEERHLLSHD